MANRKRSIAAQTLSKAPKLRATLAQSDMFTQLREKLPRVDIEGQMFFVAEGDSLYDEDELHFYAAEREAAARARELRAAASRAGMDRVMLVGESPGVSQGDGLAIIVQNGKVVRWDPGKVLSYYVVHRTFEEEQYQIVRDLMVQATQEWEATCGVRFQYRSDLDEQPATPRPSGIVFSVRLLNTNGTFYAAAFRPNDPLDRRFVAIDPQFFAPDIPYNQLGILRHELGHVLGFRHEHIRPEAPPSCPGDPEFGLEPLTPFDPHSVMHYLCPNVAGVGSKELRISETDRVGAQKVYGPSLSSFHLIG